MDEVSGSRKIRWIVLICNGFLVAEMAPAMAASTSLSGGIDNRYSDNVLRAPTNKESDVETRANLNFQYLSDPGQCSSSVDMGLGYGYWHENAYDSKVYANGLVQGECELARGLMWQASDTISEVTQDSRQTGTPDNLTRKNVFRTGPVYTLQLTKVDQLQFSVAYENTEFQEPEDPDSERIIASAAYNHSFSQTLQGGISTSAEWTELSTDEELDRESASLTFSKVWATTQVSGSIGKNRLEARLGNNSVSSDGVTASLSLVREITPASEFSLNASRQLTDQTSTIGLNFQDFNFNLTDSSSVEVTAVNARYNTRLSSGSTFASELSASRSDFLQTGNREERSGINLRYSRPITELMSFFTDAAYEHQWYEEDGSEDGLALFSMGLDYQLSSRMDLRSAIGRQQKRSDVALREYDENWIAVSLNYQFF